MQSGSNSKKAQDAKLHFLDYWRIIRIRKTVVLAVFLLVVLTTTVVTFLLKPTYASTARISIKKDNPDIGTLLGIQATAQHDPYWIQTEFEKIQSKKVLYQVINTLELNNEWAKRYNVDTLTTNETYMTLQKLIEVSQFRNTGIIEITAYSEDRKEAAAIANTIAEEYQKHRLQTQQNQSQKGISALKEMLDQKNEEVTEWQAEVDRLKLEKKIADIYSPEGSSLATPIEPQTVLKMETERASSKAFYLRYKTLYDSLSVLPRDELRKAALTAIPNDLNLSRLFNEYDVARQQIARNRAFQGPENPEMRSLLDLKETLEQQIEDRLDGILIGLQTQLKATEAQEASLADAVDEAKQKDAENIAEYRPYFRAKRELETLQKVRDMIFVRMLQEIVDSRLPRESIVEIYDPAEEAMKPVRPNIGLNIALGVLVGLVVGVGLAFFIEYLDTSVKTIDDVEQALGAPVLGVIPQNVGSLLEEGPDSPHAEAYRVLRTNVLFSRKTDDATTITVVSGGAGEGKSTTIFNLSTIFAQNNNKVLVVDSDLRRPSLHKVVGVSNAKGLTNYLMQSVKLDEVIQTTSLSTLDFLPSGKLPSSSLGILNSTQMKTFVKDVKNRYDFVFFDSPPIMGVSDASILASEVDMSLLVIQYRKYPQAMTVRAKQMVEKVGGNLLGVVLNNINISQDSYYYYYSGYYYDYYSKAEDSKDLKKKNQKNGEAKPGKTTGRQELNLKKKY
ncbi:MAG: Tyrosine-protein kinase YwqD [Verrucomicrobia subdivision 3 bacterium]|nr:Tyrosine-protein kinase YwqD [Limisphaerales bacterium]MCS1414683.1 Tyrosine-protein kinase YwqD [Limisphaerales bacterium]